MMCVLNKESAGVFKRRSLGFARVFGWFIGVTKQLTLSVGISNWMAASGTDMLAHSLPIVCLG
jgi:hypothetical protein